MSQLQELIDLALSDGTVSDIEMSMLRSKARDMNIDESELLRLIDQRKKLGVGSDKVQVARCPSCKEPIKEFAPYCEWCGASVAKAADRESITAFHQRVMAAKPNERSLMIASYPLPLAKQEIIELLSIAVPASRQMTRQESMSYVERHTMNGPVFSQQFAAVEETARSWGVKAAALISHSRALFVSDSMFLQQLEVYQKQLDENVNRREIQTSKEMKKLGKVGLYLVLGFVALMIYVSIMAALE
jgi:hypothetical protein